MHLPLLPRCLLRRSCQVHEVVHVRKTFMGDDRRRGDRVGPQHPSVECRAAGIDQSSERPIARASTPRVGVVVRHERPPGFRLAANRR